MISLHYFWEGIVCSVFVCGRNQRVLYKLAMKTFLHWKKNFNFFSCTPDGNKAVDAMNKLRSHFA